MKVCSNTTRPLLETLPYLAEDHVVLCVGNEDEIERMLLGTCTILLHDWTTCITAMMDPMMAGWFE